MIKPVLMSTPQHKRKPEPHPNDYFVEIGVDGGIAGTREIKGKKKRGKKKKYKTKKNEKKRARAPKSWEAPEALGGGTPFPLLESPTQYHLNIWKEARQPKRDQLD